MDTTSDVTLNKEACPMTRLLINIGKTLLMERKNVGWQEVEAICRICRDRGLKINGTIPSVEDLETGLKKRFETSDELSIEGICVTGYPRRIGWDLVWGVGFYPDVHAHSINMGTTGADQTEINQNN